MRRPFVWLCTALAVFPAVKYAVAGSARDVPLRQAAEELRVEYGAEQEFTAAGTVADCSAVSSGVRLSVNHLTIRRKDNSEQKLFPRLILNVTTEQREIIPGDEIMASGRLMLWESASNPGQFDARAYYFANDTVGMLTRASVHKVRTGGESLTRILYRIRRALGQSCEKILGEEQARITEAVCLGEKGLPEQEWKDFYQEGGIAHILAVSGLHISLVGMCLYRLLRKSGAPFWLCCGVSGAAAVAFAAMTGSGISAVRAVIMFCFWLGAQLWGRKYDMPTATGAAALILLVQDIRNLRLSSFVLSFAAVLTIALLIPCLEKILLNDDYERPGAYSVSLRPGRQSVSALLSCAGIWIGMLPVTLYFFYQSAPWSIFLNLAVVPMMTVLMAFGLLSAAAGLVSAAAGRFLAAPVCYLLGFFDFLCTAEQKLPLAVWVAGRPAVWKTLLYYGILLTAGGISYRMLRVWRRKRDFFRQRDLQVLLQCKRKMTDGQELYFRRRIDRIRTGRQHRRKAAVCLLWFLCAACGVLLLGVRSGSGGDKLQVVCLDVGQGDAALLRLPGNVSCLIDGGSSSEPEVWRYRIGQTVRYYGVRTLDYIFLSHADQDHISGVVEFLEDYEPGFAGENIHGVTVRHLVLPPAAEKKDFQELYALAQRNGIQVLQMEAGAAVGTGSETPDLPADQTGQGFGGSAPEKTGGWSITCLAPESSLLTGDRNEDSMVLMLRYGAFSMLFTGDLEGSAERRLALSGKELKADVLKVGHHGSKNASSQEFLEQVRPAFAVISCEKDNSYGHPAEETLERFGRAGCRILATFSDGAVIIVSDGKQFTAESFADGP